MTDALGAVAEMALRKSIELEVKFLTQLYSESYMRQGVPP